MTFARRILATLLVVVLWTAGPSVAFAAVAFGGANYSAAANTSGTTSTTIGVTSPATSNPAMTAGHLAIAVVAVSMSSAADPGDISVVGFTELYDVYFASGSQPVRTYVGYRTIQPGDTASFVASWTSAGRGASWALLTYSGADTAAPVVSGQSNTNVQAWSAPSITPTTASDILLFIGSEFGSNGPYTKPGSMTLRADNNSASSLRPEILVADEQLASGSATGVRTATAGGGVPTQGIALAITAASGGGGGGGAKSLTLLGVGE